jgi:diguanylate cyclase (GGDEF)-like protein
VRAEDAACRTGGEEFAVIARNADQRGAVCLAERLRAAFCRELRRDPKREEPLTVSIGVAAFDIDRHRDVEGFFSAADAQLYAAKQAGRDRVCAAAPTIAPNGT